MLGLSSIWNIKRDSGRRGAIFCAVHLDWCCNKLKAHIHTHAKESPHCGPWVPTEHLMWRTSGVRLPVLSSPTYDRILPPGCCGVRTLRWKVYIYIFNWYLIAVQPKKELQQPLTVGERLYMLRHYEYDQKPSGFMFPCT